MFNAALRCLAKKNADAYWSRTVSQVCCVLKGFFFKWFGIQKLRVGESHCALLAFCPWLHCRETSQCWWIWEDGERQAETLPVNQQGCLAPLLHSLGDKICVILPWGISPRRCLHPPFTVPSPLQLTLFLHVSLHNSTSLLFLFPYQPILHQLNLLLPIFPSIPVDLQLCSASQRHPVILLISHSLVYFSFSSMIATPSFTSLFSPSLKKAGQRQQAKQNRTTAKKKKKELKKKHRSIRLLTV